MLETLFALPGSRGEKTARDERPVCTFARPSFWKLEKFRRDASGVVSYFSFTSAEPACLAT
jgi:hypothetical protein